MINLNNKRIVRYIYQYEDSISKINKFFKDATSVESQVKAVRLLLEICKVDSDRSQEGVHFFEALLDLGLIEYLSKNAFGYDGGPLNQPSYWMKCRRQFRQKQKLYSLGISD